MAIAKSKKSPQINTEAKAILEIFSFFSNIGERKNRKNKPLKAKILLAPVKKILSAPFPKIGRDLSIRNKSTTKITVSKILIKVIGTIIVLDLIMDFLSNKFATTATNKKSKIIKAIG